MKRIGFVGLGNMGRPMASRLAESGFTLSVMDSDGTRARSFGREFGAAAMEDGRSLATEADVVITMLPNSAVVADVLTGERGILAGMRQGSILLEMSSGDPAITRALADDVASVGASLVDAPVSGGVARASKGELAIMVGGEPGSVARVTPVLDVLGSSVRHTGGVGSAHAMKALNNLVSAGGFLIGIEALLIGKKAGLDPETMVDVLNESSGMNNSTRNKFKQFVLSGSYASGFAIDLMAKDLSIALGVADEIDVPFARLCRDLWSAAAGEIAGQDHTSLAKVSQRRAGIRLAGRDAN